MRKLTELNGWDLTAALAELAEPIGNLVNDDAFWDKFVACTRRGIGLKQKDTFRFLLQTYSALIPVVLKTHRQDFFAVMSVVEGKPIDEVMQMEGMTLLADLKEAFKEYLAPFFTKSAPSASRG